MTRPAPSYQQWRAGPWSRPVKHCPRCNRIVSAIHEHVTKPGETLDARK